MLNFKFHIGRALPPASLLLFSAENFPLNVCSRARVCVCAQIRSIHAGPPSAGGNAIRGRRCAATTAAAFSCDVNATISSTASTAATSGAAVRASPLVPTAHPLPRPLPHTRINDDKCFLISSVRALVLTMTNGFWSYKLEKEPLLCASLIKYRNPVMYEILLWYLRFFFFLNDSLMYFLDNRILRQMVLDQFDINYIISVNIGECSASNLIILLFLMS